MHQSFADSPMQFDTMMFNCSSIIFLNSTKHADT